MKALFLTPIAVGTLCLGLVGCGVKPKNTGFPPPVRELGPASASPAIKAREARWDDIRLALGLDTAPPATAEELAAQLSKPSSLITGAAAGDPALTARYQKLIGDVAQGYLKTAFATRCASIVAAQAMGPAQLVDASGQAANFAGADMYLVQYKLQSDAAGTPEIGVRSALLTVPTTGARSAPIVMYSHGAEAGLSVAELALNFDKLQGAYVVAAPTFPGEPLCKGKMDYVANTCVDEPLVKAVGTVSPFDSDVDELLGLHNCLVRATLPAQAPGGGLSAPILDTTGKDTGTKLESILQARVKPQGGTGTYAAFPQSIVAGASRGALVAGLALSKTGAALSALAADPKALGTAYHHPSLFSCEALLFPPASMTIGQYRILFESLVKGTVEDTAFVGLPLVRKLNTLIAPYRAGAITADDAALLVASRDLTFTAPLMIAALRDWARFNATATPPNLGGKGALAFMHGVYDRIVPYNQTLVAASLLQAESANAAILTQAKAPGLDVFARSFVPEAKYLADGAAGPVLVAGQTQHGDAAFQTSTSAPVQVPGAANAVGADVTSLLGVTPAVVLGGWLTQGSCAKALTAQ